MPPVALILAAAAPMTTTDTHADRSGRELASHDERGMAL
jgi:hypothetical protein